MLHVGNSRNQTRVMESIALITGFRTYLRGTYF